MASQLDEFAQTAVKPTDTQRDSGKESAVWLILNSIFDIGGELTRLTDIHGPQTPNILLAMLAEGASWVAVAVSQLCSISHLQQQLKRREHFAPEFHHLIQINNNKRFVLVIKRKNFHNFTFYSC